MSDQERLAANEANDENEDAVEKSATDMTVEELLEKLQSLGVDTTGFTPENLHRVKDMRIVQDKRDKVREEYEKAKVELELKYEAIYAGLDTERAALVREHATATSAEGEATMPPFWLTAMRRHPFLSEIITDKDVPALSYLRDVRTSLLPNAEGFVLEFEFAPNEWFENTVLRKEYQVEHLLTPMEEPSLGGIEATPIEWKAGKNLTVAQKKVKGKGKGRPTRVVSAPAPSFFAFFNTAKLDFSEDMEDMDEEQMESIQNDFQMGMLMRSTIIPHAVHWYTGEASVDDDDEEEEEDEEGEEEDDEEGEDGEDDEDGEDGDKDDKLVFNFGAPAGGDAPAPGTGEQPECKQQ